MHKRFINTFASECLGFEENFVKIVIQILMCQILCIFKEKWFICFLQKRGAEKRKCYLKYVKILRKYKSNVLYYNFIKFGQDFKYFSHIFTNFL